MGTEKIIESDLDQGTGVSGRRPPERHPVIEEEPERPLSHDEKIDAGGPHTPEKAEAVKEQVKQGKKGFGRISFDKKNDSDIFSD
ncbi:hypothetical protein AZH53_09225 [Methanomicrobiaceae archaeon CYW5]|uniref:hypothetical protein n=1 Tax=Methanovulcanius yangii TaxID=1789227 RepID=UPI0029CA8DD4|nr:hypothetical protein [Methanovulcanius yangii]MBT8508585.1 hypothetical protein [Methanovulcanius yangii]